MKLLRLALTDFRNYQRCVWEPKGLVQVLYGPNGSGKTNLLEAVSLLAPGRGLNAAPSHILGRHGASSWGISAALERQGQAFSLNTGVQSGETTRRVFLLDGERVKTQSDVAHLCACVWLVPKMDRLFSESAAQRRRFVDRLVAAFIPNHTQQLIAHERSVAHRNRVLATQPEQHLWLDSLEASISQHAVAIAAARHATVDHLRAAQIKTEGFPPVSLQIRCAIHEKILSHPALHVEDWMRTTLKDHRHHDRDKSLTSLGAHRADFSLINDITHQSAAQGSSGQQKIMLLSLILSHGRCVQQSWGEAPFMLLDEPFVHLDAPHRQALMRAVKTLSTTTLLTGTDLELFTPMKEWANFTAVKKGKLLPRTL